MIIINVLLCTLLDEQFRTASDLFIFFFNFGRLGLRISLRFTYIFNCDYENFRCIIQYVLCGDFYVKYEWMGIFLHTKKTKSRNYELNFEYLRFRYLISFLGRKLEN